MIPCKDVFLAPLSSSWTAAASSSSLSHTGWHSTLFCPHSLVSCLHRVASNPDYKTALLPGGTGHPVQAIGRKEGLKVGHTQGRSKKAQGFP